MSALTAPQITLLEDDHPHASLHYLSPVPKIPLLEARVNDLTITVGEDTVIYDGGTGTLADFNLIETEMVLLLGTAAGLDNLGRGYVKSITGSQTSGTITMFWNSDIRWQDNAFITILMLFELRPRFPRFTISPETFYKDELLTYASQSDPNVDQHPIAIVGPCWAGFLISGSKVITLDGSESYAIAEGATITTYLWEVLHNTGGTPVIASSGSATTTITLDEPGLYWVSLTITDSNSQTQKTTRYFIAHDSTDPPFPIQTATRTQTLFGGGATLQFTISGEADEDSIPKKTPVIMWSRNFYDGTEIDVSFLRENQYVGRTHVNFCGYVTETTTVIGEDGDGTTNFTAATIHEILSRKFLYPVALVAKVEVTGAVNEWWKFPNNRLTVRRALHHLYRWHSNLFLISDVNLLSDSRLRAGSDEFTQGSLFERAGSFIENTIRGLLSCDIYGGLHAEIDAQMLEDTPRGALTTTLTLNNKHWRDDISINLRQDKEVAYATADASNWDGTTFNVFCARWGEIASSDGDSVLNLPNLIVNDQVQLNAILGRAVAAGNNPIKEITMTMAGNWSSALGCIPQQWSILTLLGTEAGNNRGVVLDAVKMRATQVTTEFRINTTSNTTVIWETEAVGRTGEFTPCPVAETPEPSSPPDQFYGGFDRIYVRTTDKGMFVITQSGVTQENTGLSGTFLNFVAGGLDPKTKAFSSSKHILIGATEGGFVYSVDGADNWSTLATASLPTPTDTAGDGGSAPTSSDLDLVGVEFDPQDINRWYIVAATKSVFALDRIYLYWTDDRATTFSSVGVGA